MDFSTLVSAGLLITIVGSAIAYFRAVPGIIYRKIRSYFVFSIEINQQDTAFDWIMLWLNQHPSTNKSKYLAVKTKSEDGTTSVEFTPLGIHFFKHKDKYLWISRSREKQTNNGMFAGLYETLTLTTLARQRGSLEALVSEAQEFTTDFNKDKILVHSSRYDYWKQIARKNPRKLSTIILPKECKEDILEDAKTFLDSRSWYEDRGIPYRRGYLLYGPPGNGKTSLIFSIASELKMNLSILSLNNVNISDGNLLDLLADLPEKSIIVIEDIDTVFNGREPASKDIRITFSGLLNALDGVASSEGRIIIMTTNHIETLDPALIRPGRTDRHVEILPPAKGLIKEMYLRFFPGKEEDAVVFSESLPEATSAAKIQETLVAKANT